MDSSSGEITRMLVELQARKEDVAPRLFELLYKELRRIAQNHFYNERAEHSLQATALVHEAYLRLVGQGAQWQNRAHFCGVASGVMRRILVDHARAKYAAKRPSSHQKVDLDEALMISNQDLEQIMSIDEALSRLALRDMRQSRVVELRYFGGLTTEEVAEVMGISINTVKRDWSVARAWLHGELAEKASRR